MALVVGFAGVRSSLAPKAAPCGGGLRLQTRYQAATQTFSAAAAAVVIVVVVVVVVAIVVAAAVFLGILEPIFEPPWGLLGAFWRHLGAFWGLLGQA